MDMVSTLPAECIALIISLTTPRDASRLTLVSPFLRSVADSDSVWEKFLPSDYDHVISSSDSASSSPIASLSKKDLYLHLCHNPIIINNGTMSFGLEKETGKKCYMVGAKGLSIAWGDVPIYWMFTSLPESRFAEVAELRCVWWFDVKARIETRIFSPRTNYTAYLVYKFTESKSGFERKPIDFGVYIEGGDTGKRQKKLLDHRENMSRLSQDRRDGWMEIEMGEFFNENGDDGVLICSMFDFDGFNTKRGLIIQGIEFRPKDG